MNILGISCYYHDSAAAILKNGELIAACAEERLNRIKHYNDFPKQAILYCLDQAKIISSDLDYIAFYDKPFTKFERILTSYISTFPKSRKAFTRIVPTWVKEKLLVKKNIQNWLGEDIPIIFCEHHLSHAASAFFVSPFKESAILTVDGVGEWTTTALGYGVDETIVLEKEIRFPHSVGLLYNTITSYLGFRVNDEEWKVMGLAPYGKPVFKEQFEELIKIKEDGSFKLNMRYFSFDYSESIMFNKDFEKLFGQPPRLSGGSLLQFHKDVAVTLQEVVEIALIRMANYLYNLYKIKNLCIAGGVGLNCVANYKILKETPFEDIFIQPAAGDDGGAIGAAFFVYNQLLKNKRKFVMKHTFWGSEYQDEDIEIFLKNKNIRYEKLTTEEMIEKATDFIANDKIIAWFQGRMEWGPRALGNRSILANPKNPRIREIINKEIKHRESFRPFAPSVLEEDALKWFGIKQSPFMLFAVSTKPEAKDLIPAVIHVDGTSRIQTVSKEDNKLFYLLLKKVKEKIGVSIVLNTSFNYAGDPIVCSPEDAYQCFLKTGIDYLFLGNYLISKSPLEEV